MTTENAALKTRSWTGFFWNMMLLSAIAVAAGVFFLQYLEHRTRNMRPQSDALANTFELLLKNSHIPASAIIHGPVQLNRENRTIWHFHPFNVTLPAQITPDGLITQLRKELLPYKVTLIEESTEGQTRHIQLSIGAYRFADAYLAPEKKETTLPRDLRGPALDATQEIETLLLNANTNPETLRINRPKEQKAGLDLWSYSLIQVQLPSTLTPGELKHLISDEMSLHNLQVNLATPEELSQRLASPFPKAKRLVDRLHVRYEGREFVEIQCFAATEASVQASLFPLESTSVMTNLNTLLQQSLPTQEELLLESAETPEEPSPSPSTPPKPRNKQAAARIALILDDGGYGGTVTERVLALDPGLSLAILPNTPHAQSTAEAAHAKGFEILLHLPMETLSQEVKAFPGELTVAMNAETIQQHLTEALAQIPHVVGVNNHTGSKFMAAPTSVHALMGILQEKGLFFIDSRTHESSQGHTLAQEIHLASAERQVFLDNDSDPKAIESQFRALLTLAREEGQAIGIGHFRENTVAFLADILPTLKKQGIELVPVSEFVE